MTWSAFMVAMRNGIQNRGNAVRQGANRTVQQTQRPNASNQVRAASSKSNQSVGNDNVTEFDFLVMEMHTGEPWMSQVLVHN